MKIYILLLWLMSVTLLNAKAAIKIEPTKVLVDEDRKVLTYDNVLHPSLTGILSGFVKQHGGWDFVYPDAYEGFKDMQNGNLHWIAPLSPKWFANTKVWRAVQKRILNNISPVKLFPFQVEGVMLRRGDFPKVKQEHNVTEGELLIRIFLNKGLKNGYSELSLYKSDGEILGAVYPKLGRVVIWNDTIPYLFKPPGMGFTQGEYSLLIKTTSDQNKFKSGEHKHKALIEERKKMENSPFVLVNASDEMVSKMDLSKHLTKKFHDSEGKVIAVFDDVLPKEDVDALRTFFLNYDSSYIYNAYDPAKSEQHDNVNWISQVRPETIVNSRIWKYVAHCAKFLSGEDQWYPYDVAMNIIQHTHHTRIHPDCETWEHEYTFLLYLSTDWSEDKYGETIFVELDEAKDEKKAMSGKERYEAIAAVRPKYGRIVIFRNIVEHSARPPSPDFRGARYTFAVKIGRTPRIAIGKKLRELLETKSEGDEGYQLFEDLHKGKHIAPDSESGTEFLLDKLKLFRKEKEGMSENDKADMKRMLSLKKT